MGLFDTVFAELACRVCGSVAEREVQFKHEASLLDIYAVGDFVVGAPAGQPLLRGHFTCPGPPESVPSGSKEHRADCWVHIDRGFLTDVTLEAPERPTPVAWWMLERAGRDAQELRRTLDLVREAVKRRRRTVAEGMPSEDATRWGSLWTLASEGALLQRLDGIMDRGAERSWPGEAPRTRADAEGG